MTGKLTQKLLDKIDWNALLEEVRRLLNIYDIKFEKIGLTSRGTLDLQSNDIVEYSGVMRATLDSLHVSNFGGEYLPDRKMLWIRIHFSWQQKNWGSNGSGLFDAEWHFDTKKWGFRYRK